MICKGIYEVLTPSVRLSRFATHVETGRPRKSLRSIHGVGAGGDKFGENRPGAHGCGQFTAVVPRLEARNLSISFNMRMRVLLDDSQ